MASADGAAAVEGMPVVSAEVLRELKDPLIIDARDPEEVTERKGGPPLEGSINVPFNMDGAQQSDRPTSASDYVAKLEEAKALPAEKDAAIITHCGAGGRGGKSCAVIASLGYTNVHNGGGPDNVRAARG
mmetsp:Transcript_64983/g.186769  ORF Transcript_64983/g.186769 Transcript_64983/m.186769 type:complete len:130 (-) Transcript_64983:110-499(-)